MKVKANTDALNLIIEREVLDWFDSKIRLAQIFKNGLHPCTESSQQKI